MGSCLSKKSEVNPAAVVTLQSNSVSLPVKVVDAASEKTKISVVNTEQKKTEDEVAVKKENCVTKHRNSHDKQMQLEIKQSNQTQSSGDNLAIGTPVRTSNCTREEVDSILIQCGRLSRSSSANTPARKKYSGSKRSYDFDAEGIVRKDEEDELEKRRQSRSRSSPSKPGRRRTPSRERDSRQQRSGSRERLVAGSGRRVSRSPGRRSDTPVGSGMASSTNCATRPGKLVSVPASLTSSTAAGNEQNTAKKIGVKRDVRSPRSQSPSRVCQPPLTLSRCNSRKTDQSPHRRNPLTEIDNNHSSRALRKASQNHQGVEEEENRSLSNKRAAEGGAVKVVQQPKGSHNDIGQPKQTKTKSISRSHDFDELSRAPNVNPNPNASSYASILLEDIHTFHQKSSTNNVAFSLPQCVTKACSIMDAVADLNSTTSSTVGSKDEKKRGEMMKFGVETELEADDDLMEPSMHKYVTMRRGANGGDMGDEESSGSNSVAGGSGSQQLWGSPLEPNSVESTSCLASKANKGHLNPIGFRSDQIIRS